MPNLSRTANDLVGQPMFRLLAEAQQMERNGRSVMRFEIGDLTGFQSPAGAVAATKASLDGGETNYTDSRGLLELREAIVDYAYETHGVSVDLDQILITPANATVEWVVRCVAEPGQEAIIPDPGFPTYSSVLSCAGVLSVPLRLRPEKGFRMQAADIRRKITSRTRLIVVNTPHNPTGACLDAEDARAIAELAAEYDLFLLCDEVYARLRYHGQHESPARFDFCRERSVILGSLSKSHAMAGWRLGYAIAPPKLAEKMSLLLQTVLSCLPAFIQRGGVQAIASTAEVEEELLPMLRLRRDRLVHGLNALPGLSCGWPDGAFYLFARLDIPGVDDEMYARRLLQEEGVCLLPGSYFGVGGRGHVRLAYAGADDATIDEALVRMKRFNERLLSELDREPAVKKGRETCASPTS
ncbi:hypothetical protein AY600_08780 [Phormidium willei BDU 130791]|nr:hypothetical protein AY600_08780 [Phormidium willei BDU 130791]